jgi:hypothetical protein
LAYDDSSNWPTSAGVQGVLAYDDALNLAERRELTEEGAIYDGPAATPASEGTTALEEGAASKILNFTERDLQKGFMKHGDDFGLSGNWNPSRSADFSRAVNSFINDPAVVEISGTYRGAPATHFFNPATGVNVIATPGGQYVSGWQLGAGQLENLLRSGAVQ